MPTWEFSRPYNNLDLSWVAIAGITILVIILLLVSLTFWIAGTMARGGLISGVNEIDSGRTSNFGEAFRAGWEKGWRLIGIGLIPSIPGLVLLFTGIMTIFYYGGFGSIARGDFPALGRTAFVPVFVLACFLVPVMILFGLLRTFADRACMIEDTGVFGSYRRGFEVLGNNLGPAILLFLLQIVLSLGIGILMVIPSILIALCCLLWPLFLLIEGSISTYFSTLWSLAWREWTGAVQLTESS
jgi:hypothetical protein